MHIEKLRLINFKNYEEAALDFSDRLNCFLGKNGSGKTNLLDAIYYLSSSKSALNKVDSQNIRFGQQFFLIKGTFRLENDQYLIECSLKEGEKKKLKVNGAEYEKLKEHVGKYPVVFISPDDTEIIREGSEIRRKFFDIIISQVDHGYLDILIEHNHFLRQRNSLLKRFAETRKIDKVLLEPYNIKLIDLGKKIFERRAEFINSFKTSFQNEFTRLTGNKEQVAISYQSDMSANNFKETFLANVEKDIILQRSNLGAHKDDFKFSIEKKPLKKFGSQGQQKSFAIALKLACYTILKNFNVFKPILLLDDIFDKLDSERIQNLLQMMTDDHFGQVFITDARLDRTKEILAKAKISANFYEVAEGEIVKSYEKK